jgi:hypothetical protein
MDDTAPKAAPNWMLESLECSEAQIAAGQTVPLEPVLDRLRSCIARMRTAADQEPPRRREA